MPDIYKSLFLVLMLVFIININLKLKLGKMYISFLSYLKAILSFCIQFMNNTICSKYTIYDTSQKK